MFCGKSRWFCVTAAVVALAFSGWASAQQTPTGKPEPKPQEQPLKEGKDLVQTALDVKCHTLCELLKSAGLVETLKGPGPFTVFAPTDEAFAKLGKDLDDLKKPENKQKLADILKHHVVKGKEPAAAIEKAKELKALYGADILITVKEGKVMLDGQAKVTKADIAASNGVIHVIDAVLMPPPAKAAEVKPVAKKAEEPKPAPKPVQ